MRKKRKPVPVQTPKKEDHQKESRTEVQQTLVKKCNFPEGNFSAATKNDEKIGYWFENKEQTISSLTIVLLVSYLVLWWYLAYFGDNSTIIAVLQVIITAIPALIIICFVSNSNLFGKINDQPWMKAAIAGMLVIYGIYAHKYAVAEVNKVFPIDPDHFPITVSFLTLIYVFTAILKPIVIAPAILLILFFGHFALIAAMQSRKKIKYFFVTIVVVVPTFGSLNALERNLGSIIEIIAHETDFNGNNFCDRTSWNKEIKGVVFLASGAVFGRYVDYENKKHRYLILECNPDSQFKLNSSETVR